MSDLSELCGSPSPRPDALVRRLARRGAPTGGFVAYGVLYGFAVLAIVPPVVVLALALLLAAVTGTPLPAWATAIVLTGGLAAIVASWLPFAAWVRRRRSVFVTLGRHGELIEGRVTSAGTRHMRRMPYTSATIEVMVDGRRRRLAVSYAGHSPGVVQGAAHPVLYHPAVPFGFAFPCDGAAVVGRWS